MFKKRNVHPIVLIVSVTMLVIAVALLVIIREAGVAESLVRLNDNWTIEHRGKSVLVPKLSDEKFNYEFAVGDTFTMVHPLDGVAGGNVFLRFNSYRTVVDVYAPDLVYTYGHDVLGKGGYVGSGYHYAFFDAHAADSVRVRFILTSPESFTSFPRFEVVPAESALCDYNARNIVSIVIGMFLVILGPILIMGGFIMSMITRKYVNILIIGVLSLMLGFWSLCYTKTLQMFSMDLTLNSVLEYVTFYLAPIPFFLLIVNMRKGWVPAWKIHVVEALAVANALFFAVTTVTHSMGVAYYSDYLLFFHAFVFVTFVFIFTFVLPFRRSSDVSSKYLTWAVGIFGLFVLAELMRYNLCEIFEAQGAIRTFSLVPFGVLFFIIALFMSYFFNLSSSIAHKAERDALATMVYVDNLTGLFNRAKCKQIFDVLDRSSSNYAIVSVDMNGLKFVNDRFGHTKGDVLLKAFAEVFRESFAGRGTTIRMGGDEYVAIVRNEHIRDMDACLQKLETLEKGYAGDVPVPLEAAYGVAYFEEVRESRKGDGESAAPVTAEDVYRLADERMYAMKQSMHSELKRD